LITTWNAIAFRDYFLTRFFFSRTSLDDKRQKSFWEIKNYYHLQ
jgi:hypothetical protein